MRAPEITAAMLADLRLKNANEIKAAELVLPLGPWKSRRCDFWTISPHHSKSYHAVSYELKASRADFLRDTEEKQQQALKWSDRFYYVTPAGLVAASEVPDWAGLMWWTPPHDRERYGPAFAYKKHAPLREKAAPDWTFVTTLLRHAEKLDRDGMAARRLAREDIQTGAA